MPQAPGVGVGTGDTNQQVQCSQESRTSASQGGDHGSDSDRSAEIDRWPHRPPTPSRDFDAYNTYITSLTNEEYQRMFFDGWTGVDPRESDSEVDSNERAALDYNPSDDEPGGVRPQNVNNTIGSREEVARQFTLHQWRMNVWDSTVNVPPLPQRRTGQYYLDDAVPPESVIQDELRTANNSQRAAGSADSVVIPTRQPTVPPPPPSHRIPPLEVQMARRRKGGNNEIQWSLSRKNVRSKKD